MDLSGVEKFADALDMVNSDKIDAVDICLPPAMHAEVAVAALSAGKHVLSEKPIALTVADAQRMAKAAAKNDRVLMVGHVLPFFPEYAWALKVIESGEYGRPIGGSFRRVISDPAWLASFWRADQVGGPMLDLHIHDAHFIRLVFGMPEQVHSIGRMRNGLAEFWHSQFMYGPQGAVVEATSGTINQQGRPFDHGFEIHLEGATLVFQFATHGKTGSYLCPPTLFAADGKVKRPKLGDGDPMNAFLAELKQVAASLENQQAAGPLDAALAVDALKLAEAQTKSLSSGKAVKLK
jgi:predicted dehydrogenase